ncbi:MAG: signal peptide peptidase SppA [Nitrospira sp.]|nr:signal peptide peptidase SppA [bacterium]MBL7050322.1 signal peptide peptidase SppA [Nitrospira sp.]
MKKVLIFFAIIFAAIAILSLIHTALDKGALGDRVALVKITGVIINSTDIIDELKEYRENDSVKAVVLRIESPGGAVAPSQEIYEEVRKLKESKKVIVSMGTVAASGGYYIAAPADMIVANAGTLTGSIGVIMEIPDISGLMEKIGVKAQVIKSGKHKDLASIYKTITPENRLILQDVLDDVHAQFISAVAEGRGMTFEEAKQLSDGRIFTGKMAKEIGLVDEIGNQQYAIRLAGELSGIEGEPKVISKEKEMSIFDLLKGRFTGRLLSDTISGVSLKYIFSP